jgi:transposase
VSKYSYEFKLKVVTYCIKGKHGDWNAAKHFNIPSRTIINTWVRKYQKYGVNGLKHNCRKYTGQFKQDVIEYMHNHHLSLTETSIKFNLGSDSVIRKWERIYYEEGPQALYEERRGKNKNMSSKPRKKELAKENEEDLIEEVQRLRMENAYLKKLQALIQERTKPKQEKK